MRSAKLGYWCVALVFTALTFALVSCSTTRRIPADDILYTGVKGVDIARTDNGGAVPAEISSSISEAVDVAPNNYWDMFSWRYPFPLGLWVYNNWPESKSGLSRWLYEKLAAEPVLVSDVRPGVRTHMIEQILDNNGYFRGTASYNLVQGKNKKKAKIKYEIKPGPEFPVAGVELLPDSTDLYRLINAATKRDSYLSAVRPRYCTDSLSAARTRITNYVRNRGYYFFRPDFIEYLADSTMRRGEVMIRMLLASNTPAIAREAYKTGKVTVRVERAQGGGIADTIALSRATLVQMMPSRLRAKSLDECLLFFPGRTFSVRSMDLTRSHIARLGIFNSVNIEAVPDSVEHGILNVNVDCRFDAPIEVSLGVEASSKSNSYLGPGLSVGVTNKNIFGGGEQLSVKLTGSYEWQTGHGRSSVFNSYEAGLSGTLAFPRMLAPKFIPRSRFNLNWTRFQLDADLLNRPHYFKMAQFNASVNYDWRLRRYVSNTLTPFKLTYTKLMHTTHEFDSIMDANPAVAQSFESQFIPQMIYTYLYDRALDRNNTINWQFTVQEAGNVFWTIYRACGKKGDKELFGTPFSQFVKAHTQLVWKRRLMAGGHWLVSRVAVGAAHAYGNSSQVPYAEQFYVGGANSIRAFTVRSIGPGSYRAAPGQPDDYFDRTGTFKFEANVEYRFPLVGPLHGAIFVDAGNVWLLKDDMMRPGGTLKASSFLSDLALGTGVGLRFDISMLVVRADLGIGIHAPYSTGYGGYYNMKSFGNSLAFHLAIGYPF